MRREDLWNALEFLDDELIVSAAQTAKRQPARLTSRLLLIAAVILLLAVTAIGAYVKWHLPQPETFAGETVKPQSQEQYTYDAQTGSYYAEDGSPAATDEAFLAQAADIIVQVGDDPIDTSQMQVVHERHERWNRNQVRITFTQDVYNGEIVFDESTGYLISVTRFTEPVGVVDAPLTETEALAAAQSWYEQLPYCQGYVYSYLNPISEDAWMYSFSRPVEVEIDGQSITLQNELEEVRISIDPRTGEFLTSNAFYVPLLDDHEPGDQPLTQEQAIEIALETTGIEDVSTWTITAEYDIVLPNWWWSDYTIFGDARAANVTRLAWTVTLERPEGTIVDGEPLIIADLQEVNIDLYTGEVLGGGMI